MNAIIGSIKEFVQNTDVRRYVSKIYEIGTHPYIESILDKLREKIRYGYRHDYYFVPDVCGFFICECFNHYLDPGIYVITDKIASTVEYLKFLNLETLAQCVVLHELAHLIFHCIIPKDVRMDYEYAKSRLFHLNLEEAYCEYCAIHGLKTGTMKVLNQNVRVLEIDELEVSLLSALPRPIPYSHFRELVRLEITKGEDVVDIVVRSFVGGVVHSKSEFRRLLHSELITNYVKRPIKKLINDEKINLLEEAEPCTDYNLYVVVGNKER